MCGLTGGEEDAEQRPEHDPAELEGVRQRQHAGADRRVGEVGDGIAEPGAAVLASNL